MKFFISLFLILFSNALCSQIVVVRQDKDGNYGSLTEEDILDERIAAILQKYTWPSCIAQDLTEEEKKALLTPNQLNIENREDIFVKKKLQELSKELDVVFVPDTFYELFLIKKSIIGKLKSFDLDQGVMSLINSDKKSLENEIGNKEIFSLKNIDGVLRNYLMSKIYQQYNDINKYLFSIMESSKILKLAKNNISKAKNNTSKAKNNISKVIFSLKAQKAFVEFLLSIYPDKSFKKGLDITDIIEKNKEDFLQKIIDLPFELTVKYSFFETKNLDFSLCLKCINLNYLAHAQNKALLLRGTSLIDKASLFGEKIYFIGSTFHKQKDPYSISFGNSLFAGYFYDEGACVYNYLVEENGELGLWKNSVVGYSLLIDKFEYVIHSLSNLFFISPFCLEAGLFGSGEFFHSRTKPAVLRKKNTFIMVHGAKESFFLDPLGIFLITRDPYKQATLFADYMAKNMIIIQRGDFNMLTPEEKEGFTELMNNHYLLEQEYKIIDFLNKNIRRMKKKDKV